jgi:hypothetical protein
MHTSEIMDPNTLSMACTNIFSAASHSTCTGYLHLGSSGKGFSGLSNFITCEKKCAILGGRGGVCLTAF